MKLGRPPSAISTIAKQYGVSYSALWHRVKRGESIDEAIQTLLEDTRPVYLHGTVYKSLREAAKAAGVSYGMVKRRLHRGWPLDIALDATIKNYNPKSRGKYIDLTGYVFGLLTVIKEVPDVRIDGRVLWWCKCVCGNHTITTTAYLRTSGTPSCGCMNTKKIVERNTTHGLARTRLYKIYHHMKDRCYNKKCSDYKWYGGRGISIHQEWLDDFTSFYKWANQNGYEPGLTIERIDVNGPYSPTNCTWDTIQEQQYNRNKRGYLNDIRESR